MWLQSIIYFISYIFSAVLIEMCFVLFTYTRVVHSPLQFLQLIYFSSIFLFQLFSLLLHNVWWFVSCFLWVFPSFPLSSFHVALLFSFLFYIIALRFSWVNNFLFLRSPSSYLDFFTAKKLLLVLEYFRWFCSPFFGGEWNCERLE